MTHEIRELYKKANLHSWTVQHESLIIRTKREALEKLNSNDPLLISASTRDIYLSENAKTQAYLKYEGVRTEINLLVSKRRQVSFKL